MDTIGSRQQVLLVTVECFILLRFRYGWYGARGDGTKLDNAQVHA